MPMHKPEHARCLSHSRGVAASPVDPLPNVLQRRGEDLEDPRFARANSYGSLEVGSKGLGARHFSLRVAQFFENFCQTFFHLLGVPPGHGLPF